jgi:hypothetical protein
MKVITENDKQLTTTEQTIYTKIVKYNKENKSINKTISKLLETGKTGVGSVVSISIKLKLANESLQAVKQSVYRFYKDKPKDQRLSLQGLGKKEGSPFIAPLSNSGGSSKKKPIKKVSTDIVKEYMSKLLKENESQHNELVWDFYSEMSNKQQIAFMKFAHGDNKKAM